MNINQLVAELSKQEVSLSLEGEDLLVNYEGEEISALLLDSIKSNKQELVWYLKKYADQEDVQEIRAIKKQEHYQLSSSQYRLWILSQFQHGLTAYNMPGSVKLEGDYRISDLQRAILSVLERHEILRTVFRKDAAGMVHQVVLESDESGFDIGYESYVHEKNPEQCAREYIRKDAYVAFDLENGPLLRVYLLQIAAQEYILYYNMHHIVSDGWSMDILKRDILAYYQFYAHGKELSIPALNIQYKDYAAWQLQQFSQPAFIKAKEYWLTQLSGDLPLLELPGQKKRPQVKTYNGAGFKTIVSKAATNNLRKFIYEQDSTLFIGLLGIWNIVLHKYTCEKDVIIGTPVAGRDHIDLENQIGFFVNTLVLRNQIDPNETFITTYNKIRKNALNAFENQIYPFDRLVDELNVIKDTSRNPVFDIMLMLQNTGEKNGDEAAEEGSEIIEECGNVVSKFDIEIVFQEKGEGLKFQINYNVDLYEPDMIKRFMLGFKQVLTAISDNPTIKIKDIDYLSPDEKNRLLYDFNVSAVDYPRHKTVIDLFEEQVVCTPDNVAVSFGMKEFTYKQLDGLASQLSYRLSSQYNIVKGDVVGVQLGRSEWSVIAVLGILKAGGVYTPIDAELPGSRKRFMVEDAKLKLLITETAFVSDVDFYVGNILFADTDHDFSDDVVSTGKVDRDATDLAYIIYTSGSTGNPKGVMIEHRSLTNYLIWAKGYYLKEALANFNFGLFTSASFDLTITSLFLPLISGGCLKVAASDINILDLLQEYFKSEISCIKLTPAHISILDGLGIKSDKIELAIVGGEELRKDHIAVLRGINPLIRIINEYGPTEATVGCIVYDVTSEDETVLIGRPISNTFIYIVDEYNNLAAEGITGEICIGGSGLARGYLNQPALTSEKFIRNPFSPATSIYKTGDLGRWLPDGNIEYKGRKDDQVKIRGHRIEPGEIEHAISKYSGVKESVTGVVKDQDNQYHLCAYIVKNDSYDRNALKTYLKATLPAYMLPDYYVTLDAIPLNNNGKTDRKKLPAPDFSVREDRLLILPETTTQKIVAGIWKQVLKVDAVSIDDSFYDLGGDSLKVIRLISQYHQVFDVKLSAEALFINTTLESHAALITSAEINKHLIIPIADTNSVYRVSDAQRKLWVISQVEEGSTAYNMPGSVKLEGNYDISNFKRAILSVLERHEILRTVFRKDEEGTVYQVVQGLNESGFDIGYEHYVNEDRPEHLVREYIRKDAYKPFDLEKGPLLRVSLLQLTDKDYILYYNMHHIISDGWSMDILARDILAYYNHYTEGMPLGLPSLRIQYKDYAAWQLAQLETEAYAAHRQYWIKKLSGELPVLDLPSYKSRPLLKTYNGRRMSTYLSQESSAGIRSYVTENGGTLFMFLIASLKVLFHRYTGQEDILIGSPVAGREHTDLEDQIGFYINTLALRSSITGNLSFNDFYDQVKQNLLASYEHQMYPLDRLTDELDVHRDGGRNALFDVRVVLQNTAGAKDAKKVSQENKQAIHDHGAAKAKFDMLFIFEERGADITLELTYDTDVYDYEIMAGLMRHYQQLVEKILTESDLAIGKLVYFPDEDKSALCYDFSEEDIIYPQELTILDLFEEQVRKAPDNIAVVSGNIKWTYEQLHAYSNQLSGYLQQKYTIGADDLVGIKLPASHWSIVAILGILKAGAAYVPIDAETPVERVQYLITDTQIKTLIILSAEEEVSRGYQVETLLLDKEWEALSEMGELPAVYSPHPENLAYVIYTSGSTGHPKGVMITHANLADYVQGLFVNTGIRSCERFALMSGIATDLGNTVIYGALLSGGALHILPKEKLLIADDVHDYFEIHAIDCTKIVPSHWIALSRGERLLLPGRMIIFGGDVLQISHVEAIRVQQPDIVIVNHYGPTETTVGKLLISLQSDIPYAKIPIGKPFSATSVYVVDKQLNLCPACIPGELLIGGKGVAKGYLNKPALTQKQFIRAGFTATEGTLYRTGDLVRMLSDGNIEFLGRIDNQVKIRGYRVELGDIESTLSTMEGVDTSLVLARESVTGDKELVAYYTSSKQIKESDLRSYLQSRLPSFMMPAYCIPIKEFPLTSNGKINRKALPNPADLEQATENSYIAPRNEQEQVLAAVWESVLKRKEIGVNANFFDLGGDSIKGILIVSRLKQKGYELKIADLLQTPVLSLLSEKLTLINREITQSLVSGDVLLTPVQKAFLSSGLYEERAHYNQSIALESSSPIDLALLDKSLEHLVKHHDALRMVYRNEGGEWRQENKGGGHKAYSLVFHDLSAEDEYQGKMMELCDALQSGIDLEHGPLLKVALFRLKHKDCVLLIIHHLVVDGVSWRILLEDLENIYANLGQKKAINLPKKTDSFQQWAKLLNEYAWSDSLNGERPYWEEVLSVKTTPLYRSEQLSHLDKGSAKRVSFTLDREKVELLQTKTHRVYSTEINDVLLTALGISILNVSGNDRVVIDMEGHGRESIIDGVDISRTIGWFTAMYPFVLAVDSESSDFSSSLIQVKEALRKVPHKGIGYGILRYLGAGFDQEQISGIIFNYLGDFGGTEDKETGLFNYSNEYRGIESSKKNDTLREKIRISGIIVNSVLQITIAYNDAVYEEQKMAALAASYKNVLTKIIETLSTDVRTYLTPHDLSYKNLAVSELLELNSNNTIEDIYPLSPLQEGLYYHWISGKDKATYCAQHSYRMHMPDISLSNIRKSYELLISRHSILRTGFRTINGELLQIVRKEVADTFTYENIAAVISPENLELYIKDYKTKDRERGFETEQDSLMRLSVIYLGQGMYEFIWSNHHILMDGWCSSILTNEFYQILMSLEMEQPLLLPKVVPYSSYIRWLEKINKTTSGKYWSEYLSDYTEKAALPFKATGEHPAGYLAREQNVRIESLSLEKLKKICTRYNITENTLIQSAWGYLLSKYNNTRDVVYGSVVSGRPGEIEGVENMVGLFINTIPLRIHYSSDMKVSDLLEQQQQAFIAGLDHHYLNLSKIQSESSLGKDLFDHIYVFENYALNELGADIKVNADKAKISVLSGQSITETHYDFDILVAPLKECIKIELRYNGNVYKEEDIIQVRCHLENVISGFIENPDMLLKDISYISEPELIQLRLFNSTAVSYPENKTILDFFEAHVRETPENTAVVFEDHQLTYKALDELSDQLANFLKQHYEVVKNDLVGIQLDRSVEMLVAIFAILKTGAAYVPLDMQYPAERIRYIQEDSHYKVCIDKEFVAVFNVGKNVFSKVKLPVQISGTDAAYGIYTSGSTGHPKGVLNSHAGLYNRLLWMRDDLKITHQDILLQKTPYTFDVSVWELLMPAVTGCRLVFAKPEGHRDPEYLQELIKASAISIIHFVPSMLGIFLENLNPDYCSSLRHIVCSGEALPGPLVEECKNRLPWVRIHNLYGPTEAAIDVTSIDLTNVNTKEAGVSIGKPVANTGIYIVDKDFMQQPVGVPGELLIEGVQVAQGYLNRPDLNREKFIPSPFTKGERVYRTGDLAKWLPNGEIFYVGRIDNQVKIRGNRIELGEIESAIQLSGYVHNVAVIVKETKSNHKYLVGYIIPGESYTEDALYSFLTAHLPEYMVPARMIALKDFPLTTSGKVNRKALSDLEVDSIVSGKHVAPGNAREAELAAIWESVLGYSGVSVCDDFFRIGGDSILAIRLISKINRKYDTNLTIGHLYEFNSIQLLSQFVEQRIASIEQEQRIRSEIVAGIEDLKESVLAETAHPEDIEDIYPMTDIQNGMVILSDLSPGSGVYHDQFVFQIPLVDKDLFKKAFALLVRKHATLRTRLDLVTYKTSVQIVKKEADFSIDYKDISDLATGEKKAYIQQYMLSERKRPFNTGAGLLWRISLFKINDSASIFIFQFHHAILDGWSLASLNTELFGIYRQLEEGVPLTVEPLKATNRDAIIAELYDKRNPETIDFWKTELTGFKKPDIFTNSIENQQLSKVYDFKFKHQLEGKCKNDEVTTKTVIYGAFIYALKLINYESDFVVGVLANNRPIVEDGDKLLGCFLNTIPVRNRFENLSSLSLSDYFKEVENNLARIRKNERLTLYGITKIMNENAAGGSPFFDILFNYVNFHIYNTLGLDTDKDYKESLREEINEDSFELTNTALDFTANTRGNSLTLTLRLKRGLKNDVTLAKILHYVEIILTNYVANAEIKVNKIDYLTDSEKQLSAHAVASVYVVDKQLNLCPAGIPGELLIAAKNAGNNAGVTQTQFVRANFSSTTEMLYRTGSLVRMLSDGSIEFLGKIDTPVEISTPREEPVSFEKNEVEASLMAIWERVLEYKGFDIHDNFFRIGGDSLLVVKLKRELEKTYNRSVNLVDLFNHTTIAGQARLFMDDTESDAVSEIDEIKF